MVVILIVAGVAVVVGLFTSQRGSDGLPGGYDPHAPGPVDTGGWNDDSGGSDGGDGGGDGGD